MRDLSAIISSEEAGIFTTELIRWGRALAAIDRAENIQLPLHDLALSASDADDLGLLIRALRRTWKDFRISNSTAEFNSYHECAFKDKAHTSCFRANLNPTNPARVQVLILVIQIMEQSFTCSRNSMFPQR
jgi:hypothetical protein